MHSTCTKSLARRLSAPAVALAVGLAMVCILGWANASPASQAQGKVGATTSRPVAPIKWIIGKSVRHRPIAAYRFGKGRETTVIFGVFHGDEPGGKVVCEQLVAYLQKHPEAYVRRTVIVVPVVNPDGIAAGTRVNANRVDMNRNWPVGWRKAGRGELSHGKQPLSEPEVQAVRSLLAKYLPTKVISLHQYKNMLNPTSAGGIALARQMARYNHLRVDTSIGYPTPGSFGDYCGLRLKAAMVTYELPGGKGLWLGARQALLAAISFHVPGK